MVVARRVHPRTSVAVSVPDYLRDLIAKDRCPPHEARGLVYRAVVRAANRGAPCPTNEMFSIIVGYETPHGTVELLKRLERIGLIKVSRHQRSRQVTICNTGKKTRPCTNETPHWRLRAKEAEESRG